MPIGTGFSPRLRSAFITVDARGENQIIVIPGANARVTAEQVRAALTAIPDIAV